ncbi:MAG: AmmeMemoRadiSam system protein A [Campylobacterota bacterium]|nr:AmmeMemoRadiSam system protein A [Campylobacterota bacterium]
MKNILIELASRSIRDELENSVTVNKHSLLHEHPEFNENRATFVTLNLNGQLRGCIGSLLPHRNLIDDIVQNAKAAAFQDPRFLPLSKEEFEEVEIELSLLSVPKPLEYSSIDDLKSKVSIGKDGVILRLDGYQATFLPQVWEQLPTFELFFNHLCQKAGLSGGCLAEHPEISLYQVEKIT